VRFTPTAIPEVVVIEPDVHRDGRGFFLETYHADRYREHGIAAPFVQDNHSRSAQGVLRGLHMQVGAHPQGKLVRVTSGRIFDVAVDVRAGSPTYRQWVGVELDDVAHRQLWIPPGLAHGFLVMSESVDVQYKTTDYYSPSDEVGIRWDDPALAIAWPDLGTPYVLSAKDRAAPLLDNALSSR
jgi:dTDP-4-dehydrorhamnose 3,5-epimerase